MTRNCILGLAAAVAVLLLAACAPIPPAATSSTTSQSAPGPAAVPPPTEDLARLRANSWQWVAIEGAGGRIEVEDPAAYRLTFNTDATLGIAADCASAGGAYQGEAGKLEIDIETGGQDCGTDSRAGALLAALSAAEGYTFEGGQLRMEVAGESGRLTLVFEPAASPAPVPTPASQGAGGRRWKS